MTKTKLKIKTEDTNIKALMLLQNCNKFYNSIGIVPK